MKERILNTLKNYGKRAGTKLLSYLLEHLNKEFSFIQLDRMLHDENKLFKEDDNELMDCFADIINIPMCDQRTIDECKGRIRQIDRMIDQSVNGEKSHNIIELMSEKREIQKYLMEVTGRSGKIRYFKNEYSKIKDGIMKNIHRVLKDISKIDPECAELLHQCLEIRKYSIRFSTTLPNSPSRMKEWIACETG